jgi:hypothetical protein
MKWRNAVDRRSMNQPTRKASGINGKLEPIPAVPVRFRNSGDGIVNCVVNDGLQCALLPLVQRPGNLELIDKPHTDRDLDRQIVADAGRRNQRGVRCDQKHAIEMPERKAGNRDEHLIVQALRIE